MGNEKISDVIEKISDYLVKNEIKEYEWILIKNEIDTQFSKIKRNVVLEKKITNTWFGSSNSTKQDDRVETKCFAEGKEIN